MMKTRFLTLVSVFILVSFMVFAQKIEPNDASKYTIELNKKVEMPTSAEDFDNASKGFIAPFDNPIVKNSEGRVVFNYDDFKFIKGDAPNSVNPSLWRQSILINGYAGLFKVADGIYQIRSADVSNMTIIEGNKGLIVIDPLAAEEPAKAGMELYYKHRPKYPIVAVIYTHSHVDHYGGVKGVVTEEEVKKGKVKIVAPDGFLEHTISENVYAGTAMSRRAIYGYGSLLERSAKGTVGSGIGTTGAGGNVTLIPPTLIIKKDGEKHKFAGIEIEFMLVQNTEAPAEMVFYVPKYRALCGAEIVCHTLHNLVTLRGAQARDSKAWWQGINKMNNKFTEKSDVLFVSHTWPVWGEENIAKYCKSQRDLYKYIHDQTLHFINKGYTGVEIAEMLKLPDSLYREASNRGYYGSLSHNVRAVYQFYLGWFDGNPVNLNRYPPEEEAKKYVSAMGGIQSVVGEGEKAINSGDYRWASTMLSHAVFSDPSNKKAKDLLATALEQLGYQTENATWRNIYLEGAYELRNGFPSGVMFTTNSPDSARAMPMDMVFDYMGIQLNAEKAKDKVININWEFKDIKEKYATTLENSVFVYSADKVLDSADAKIVTNKSVINDINAKKTTFKDAIDKGEIVIEGSKDKVLELLSMLEEFNMGFNIVTP